MSRETPIRQRGARRTRRLALVLALVLVVGAAACSDRRDNSSTSSGGGGGGGGGNGSGGSATGVTLDTSQCPNGADDTTGVSGNTITFGSSYPQSGLYAPFADVGNGAKAYLDYLNETKGGVTIAGKKYKVEIKDKDDQYTAAKTLSNTQSLVNDDKVFGMFSVIGTSNNIAIRDTLGQQCIPDFFAGTGSPAWGNPKYPWLIGSTLSPYSDEVNAFVEYLKKNKPDATVAILYATDDFGKAYEQTFKSLIKGTKIKVVKEQTYNPEDNMVDSQVTTLAATKADAFLMGATLLACPAALKRVQATGWKTIVYGSATCAAKTLIGLAGPAADGLISSTNIKDPSNPRYKDDPEMQLYMANIEKYWPGDKKTLDKTNGIVAYGWTQGALLAATLEKAKAATRAAVMTAARNIDPTSVGLVFEGAKLHSGKNDPYLGEQFQLVQYDASKGYFNNVGSLVDYDGKTASFTPPDLING